MDLVKIVGENTRDPDGLTPVRVDEEAQALVTMDSVHARIHMGKMYSADYLNTALLNASNADVLIVLTQEAHVRVFGAAGGDATLTLHEGSTVSANGTGLTLFNRNRLSANTASASVFHTPTVTGVGTPIAESLIPGGSHGNAAGGTMNIFEEWILGAGTYLVRLTNVSGATVAAQLQVDVYEPS